MRVAIRSQSSKRISGASATSVGRQRHADSVRHPQGHRLRLCFSSGAVLRPRRDAVRALAVSLTNFLTLPLSLLTLLRTEDLVPKRFLKMAAFLITSQLGFPPRWQASCCQQSKDFTWAGGRGPTCNEARASKGSCPMEPGPVSRNKGTAILQDWTSVLLRTASVGREEATAEQAPAWMHHRQRSW